MSTSPNEPVSDPQPDTTPPNDDEQKQQPEEETAPEYVDDSQLPEDLRPSDDNPLAQNEDE